jgi:hypothetical protein
MKNITFDICHFGVACDLVIADLRTSKEGGLPPLPQEELLITPCSFINPAEPSRLVLNQGVTWFCDVRRSIATIN